MTDLPRMAWTNAEAFRLHCVVLAIGACCGQPEAVIPLAKDMQTFLRPPKTKRKGGAGTIGAPVTAHAGNVILLGRKGG